MSPGVIPNSVMAGIWTALPATVVGISATNSGSGTLLKMGVGWGVGSGVGVGTAVGSGVGSGVGVGVATEQPAMRRRPESTTMCAFGVVRHRRAATDGVVRMGGAMIAPDGEGGLSGGSGFDRWRIAPTAVLPPAVAGGDDGGECLDNLRPVSGPDPCAQSCERR